MAAQIAFLACLLVLVAAALVSASLPVSSDSPIVSSDSELTVAAADRIAAKNEPIYLAPATGMFKMRMGRARSYTFDVGELGVNVLEFRRADGGGGKNTHHCTGGLCHLAPADVVACYRLKIAGMWTCPLGMVRRGRAENVTLSCPHLSPPLAGCTLSYDVSSEPLFVRSGDIIRFSMAVIFVATVFPVYVSVPLFAAYGALTFFAGSEQQAIVSIERAP